MLKGGLRWELVRASHLWCDSLGVEARTENEGETREEIGVERGRVSKGLRNARTNIVGEMRMGRKTKTNNDGVSVKWRLFEFTNRSRPTESQHGCEARTSHIAALLSLIATRCSVVWLNSWRASRWWWTNETTRGALHPTSPVTAAVAVIVNVFEVKPPRKGSPNRNEALITDWTAWHRLGLAVKNPSRY